MEQGHIPSIDSLHQRHCENSMLSLITAWWDLNTKLDGGEKSAIEHTKNWHKFLVITKIIKKRGFWSNESKTPRYKRGK